MRLVFWKEISGEYEEYEQFEPRTESRAKKAIHFNIENQVMDVMQVFGLDAKIGISNISTDATKQVCSPFIHIENKILKDIDFSSGKVFRNLNLGGKRVETGLKHFFTGLNEIGFYDEFKVEKQNEHNLFGKQKNEFVNVLTDTTKEETKMMTVFETRIYANQDLCYVIKHESIEEFENQLRTSLSEVIKAARKSDGYTAILFDPEETGTTLLVNPIEKSMVIEKNNEKTASPNWKQSMSKTVDKFIKDAFGEEYPQVETIVEDEIEDKTENKIEMDDLEVTSFKEEKEVVVVKEEKDSMNGIEKISSDEETANGDKIEKEIDEFAIDEVDIETSSSDEFTIDEVDIEKHSKAKVSTIDSSSLNIVEKYKTICPDAGAKVGILINEFETRFSKYITNVEIKSCYIKVETKPTSGKVFRIYFHSIRKGSDKLRICQKNLPFLEGSEAISNQRSSRVNVFYNVDPDNYDGWLELMAEHITADSEEQSMKTREKWEKEITEFRKQVNEKPISQPEMSNLKKINEETIWSYNRKYHIFGNEINLYAFINFNITGKLIYGTGFEMEERSILMVPMNMAEIDKEIGRDNFEDNVSLYNALKDFFVNQLFNDENDFVIGPS